MFGEQQFIETPVIGLLLMFGVSPLIVALHARWRGEEGFCPPLKQLAGLSEKGSTVTLLVVAAFVVGIVGNQVLDAMIDDEWTIGFANYEELYEDWRCQYPDPNRPATLKLAEHRAADGPHEYTRAYLLRHRSAVRVMRAAAAAAILFLLSINCYESVRQRLGWKVRRYKPWHFAASVLAIALLVFTYLSEVRAVNRRVFELATGTRAAAAIKQLDRLSEQGKLKKCD